MGFVRSLHHGMKLLFLFVIAALVCATFAAPLQGKKKNDFPPHFRPKEGFKGDNTLEDELRYGNEHGFGVSWDKNPTEKKKNDFPPHFRPKEGLKGDNTLEDELRWGNKHGFGVSWDKNPTEKKKNDFRPHFRVSGFRGGDNKFEDWRRRGKRNKMQIKPFDVKGDNK